MKIKAEVVSISRTEHVALNGPKYSIMVTWPGNSISIDTTVAPDFNVGDMVSVEVKA